MLYDPGKHHRRSIRLKNYDYSQPGSYFITIVTHNRQCLFGNVVNGKMRLNENGKIARQCWLDIPNHFPHAKLDEFIVMPDHVHGIIVLHDIAVQNIVGIQNFESLRSKPLIQNAYQHIIPGSIGSIVRGFKIGVTKWFRQDINRTKNFLHQKIWQRNYFEHVIRNKDELIRIREYIVNNPAQWENNQNFIPC